MVCGNIKKIFIKITIVLRKNNCGDKMKEIIDEKNQIKMMALLICGISYGEEKYLVFSVKRTKDEANIFVSKLVNVSDGMAIDSHFKNGEKDVLDDIVKRILNQENEEVLNKDGFTLIKDVSLTDINSFDVDACYVSTVEEMVVKRCLSFYNIVTNGTLDSPVIEVKDDKRKLNQGAFLNIFFIIFGVIVVVLGIITIFKYIFK